MYLITINTRSIVKVDVLCARRVDAISSDQESRQNQSALAVNWFRLWMLYDNDEMFNDTWGLRY